jgi:hypothetical protein
MFKGQDNVDVVLGEVRDVDLAAREVTVATDLEDHEQLRLPYDTLIAAAGRRTPTSATRTGSVSRPRSSRSRAPSWCAGGSCWPSKTPTSSRTPSIARRF